MERAVPRHPLDSVDASVAMRQPERLADHLSALADIVRARVAVEKTLAQLQGLFPEDQPPPSGAIEVCPGLLTGNETTPKSTFASARLEICQGPLSIIAALPAMNWSLTSAWVQVTTLLDDTPLSTRSFHSVRASATCGSCIT